MSRPSGRASERRTSQRLPTTFADVSNLDKDNKPFAIDDRRRLFAIGNRLWHSDSSFKVIPAKYSLLHAHCIPSKGGNTEFADMRAAYDALDQETKDLGRGPRVRALPDLLARQSSASPTSHRKSESASSPCVSVSCESTPSTGRKSLYLASHAGSILGWPVPEAQSFLMDLTEIATQRQFVYAHEWSVGDLVMWDNRATMHRGRPFPANEPRDVRRTTLMGDGPTVAQAG